MVKVATQPAQTTTSNHPIYGSRTFNGQQVDVIFRIVSCSPPMEVTVTVDPLTLLEAFDRARTAAMPSLFPEDYGLLVALAHMAVYFDITSCSSALLAEQGSVYFVDTVLPLLPRLRRLGKVTL